MAFTTLYNKNINTPGTETDELYSNVGASTFTLGEYPRAFFGVTVRTASGGGGTLLAEGVDYTLENLDTALTAEAGFNIYSGIKFLNYTTGDLYFSYSVIATYTDVGIIDDIKTDLSALQSSTYVEKRQTVLYGSIDSNGYANFLTGNGAATLTLDATPTPVVVTWASGDANYKATISSDLTLDISGYGNGTYYAYVNYNNGTPTLGAVSLVPTDGYGAASTTNNQHHFRIPEMKMYVGNGSTASETLRVFVGEFVVASGLISGTPLTYALRGEYVSTLTAVNTSAWQTYSHNIGASFAFLDCSGYYSDGSNVNPIYTRANSVDYMSTGGLSATGHHGAINRLSLQWYTGALPRILYSGSYSVATHIVHIVKRSY